MGKEAGEELPIVYVVAFHADMRASLLIEALAKLNLRNAELKTLTGASSRFLQNEKCVSKFDYMRVGVYELSAFLKYQLVQPSQYA